MFKQTALTSCDSYKLSHAEQYPPGTTKVYSNFTPRSLNHLNVPSRYNDGKISFVGLQLFLKELKEVWDETFFKLDIDSVCKEFEEFVAPFCGPNGFNVTRLRELHSIGYLPITIKALKEGSRVPAGVPVLTITNTVPEAYWLPNFLESWMSAAMWKSSTSATISAVYRKIIDVYAEETGGNAEFVSWQGHDFSTRGMSGIVDSAYSGVGHLAYFTGSDNIPAVKAIKDVYGCSFIAGSVPATEHSVMCAGGKESEIETFRRLIKTYPSGVVSIVSDTWDFWNVITNIAAELKDDILARTPDALGLAKVVFRPDSGDPVEIICGTRILRANSEERAVDDMVFEVGRETPHGECGAYEVSDIFNINGEFRKITVQIDWNRYDKQYYYIDGYEVISNVKVDLSPQEKGAIECLADIFGTTTNEKGFKTLNQRVGLIYGDSITPQRADEILLRLKEKGFASDNVVFGIGSYTYQYNTRDTLGFAMKATYVEINGEGMKIFKDPKTDSGTKKSAKGLLRVINKDGKLVLEDGISEELENTGELQVVFHNGELVNPMSFDDVRKFAFDSLK